MIKLSFLIVLITFLSGCMKTTQTVTDETFAKWKGMPVSVFFLQYGAPSSKYQATETQTIYKWVGGVASVSMPMTANTTYNANQFGGNAFTTFSGGQTVNMSCQIDIITESDRIVSMRFYDSIGAWRLSRCDEMLNPD